MPELIEQMYCSQQIVIPPKYPYILKRYCKAAIKTQPYDLLRWSYEYFKALAEHRPPPVKLRLEYPVFSTEGGLTRGCLKVLAQQLSSMKEVPLPALKAAWRGFCLDYEELRRILCLCEVYQREDNVPFLHFMAVAGGLLTKTLTHTMILLCETLTKEPDGGSAAIPVEHFLLMYKLLARMDASKDVKYINGFREGFTPQPEAQSEASELKTEDTTIEEESPDDFWHDNDLKKISIIDDKVPRSARISMKLNLPVIGKLERSPSVERAGQIDRENYLRERKERAEPDEEVDQKLREISASKMSPEELAKQEEQKAAEKKAMKQKDEVVIVVFDENDAVIPYEIYGEPKSEVIVEEEEASEIKSNTEIVEQEAEEQREVPENIEEFVAECYNSREERREDLQKTFDEIAELVDKFKTTSYDLGMVAGRQMSTTSGEFIVHYVEQEIMDYVNEQIAILPDPSLKKKKAKPEEVAMVRNILDDFLDENMDVIVPEEEEVEEEEEPLPKIAIVYAVPGIGPSVEESIIREVEEYALDVSRVQADLFMPRNIRHFLCPPLEKCIEYEDENQAKKEQIPTGGTITD
ncbi:caldesmon-like [Battus philenor]|uniref:caldesmon-like n=1 Tax=Battus philenor TaxID=42288 RepID=UPI0035CF46AE